jgi:hypothetical protein
MFSMMCLPFSFHFEAELELDMGVSSDQTRAALFSLRFAKLAEELDLFPDRMWTRMGRDRLQISAIPPL